MTTLIVRALKNPGEGFLLPCSLSKPGSGVCAVRVLNCSVELRQYLLARRTSGGCSGRRPKGYF